MKNKKEEEKIEKSIVYDKVELKKVLKKEKVIFGTDRAIKELKQGKIKMIFLASNCKAETKEDLTKYTKISKVELIQLEIPNRELGTITQKPFSVSVISILK